MGITTKRGDRLTTYLYSGGKISKSDLRCQACGTGDEVVSFLGLSKSLLKDKKLKSIIDIVQKDLFAINSEIMTSPAGLEKLKNRITNRNIKKIEKYIQDFEDKRDKNGGFFLPADNAVSASFNVCRAVSRRAEREIVKLAERGSISNKYIPVYYNRLSDLLYLISLKLNQGA